MKLPSPTRNKWLVFAAVTPGTFMALLDEFGLNQAIPSIADHFDASIPEVQWIVLGYLLTTGALLIPIGRVADIIGHRRIYLIGICAFTAGAFLAGSAPSIPALISFKIIQGVGGAMVQATTIPILTNMFLPSERGKALGLFMGTLALGAIVGPVVGGAAVTLIDWRAMLYLAGPIGIISIVLALIYLGFSDSKQIGAQDGKRRSFDWVGAALSTTVLVLLLMLISNGNEVGWTSSLIVIGFAVVVALFVIFVVWELKVEQPIFPLDMFRSPTFVVGQATMFLVVLGNSAIFFLLPFYLQEVVEITAVMSGLIVSAVPLAFLTTGPFVGHLSDSMGWRRFVPFGLVLSTASMAMLARLTPDTPLWWPVVTMLLMGFGLGFIFSPAQNAVYGMVKPDGQGVVTGFINMARNTATLSSVAIGTAIVTATMAGLGFEPSLDAVREIGGVAIKSAFVEGMTKAFIVGAIVVVVGLIFSLVPNSVYRLVKIDQSEIK